MSDLHFEVIEDEGLIELFVDGELLTEWVYEGDPETTFKEFEKVFNAGFDAGFTVA